jgi:16S rRNA (guanine966-N2)-methyltransferase
LPHQLRIIGGRWRGTKLRFPAVDAIRPTPDRVRETLFNWLAPTIGGARCLDLFAGSGALGLEALSRGAREVVFVDRDARIGAYLRETLVRLKSGDGKVLVGDAQHCLKESAGPFDVVFLDPPFGAGLGPRFLAELALPGVLAPGAFVYVESEAEVGEPVLPPGWLPHRSGRAGKVGYHLVRTAA